MAIQFELEPRWAWVLSALGFGFVGSSLSGTLSLIEIAFLCGGIALVVESRRGLPPLIEVAGASQKPEAANE